VSPRKPSVPGAAVGAGTGSGSPKKIVTIRLKRSRPQSVPTVANIFARVVATVDPSLADIFTDAAYSPTLPSEILVSTQAASPTAIAAELGDQLRRMSQAVDTSTLMAQLTAPLAVSEPPPATPASSAASSAKHTARPRVFPWIRADAATLRANLLPRPIPVASHLSAAKRRGSILTVPALPLSQPQPQPVVAPASAGGAGAVAVPNASASAASRSKTAAAGPTSSSSRPAVNDTATIFGLPTHVPTAAGRPAAPAPSAVRTSAAHEDVPSVTGLSADEIEALAASIVAEFEARLPDLSALTS
jgi:hypothetical protein